jgi:hypothetical protein
MKRPDIEKYRDEITVDTETSYFVITRMQRVCDYALYLEKQIHDMKDCSEPFPHPTGGIL